MIAAAALFLPGIRATAAAQATAARTQSVSIEFSDGAFRVLGWKSPQTPPEAAGWRSTFAVFAGPASPEGDLPPMIGTYSVNGNVLDFRPAYALAPGVRYHAIFTPPGGGRPVEKIFDGPPRDVVARARVERVFPTSSVLPSNQLRLYIYFSAPMSRDEASRRVHLLDENGKVLPDVFLPAEELWDPGFTRLTMTFDPGRIKRGLTSNQKMGPPIAAGKAYTLVIDKTWPDARGVPMIAGFRKQFRGGPPERTPPDPAQWRIAPPHAGGSAALILTFTTPMNYPLLQRMIGVAGPQGNVPGKIDIGSEEKSWRFTPQQPWKPGDYKLVVDMNLEDLAGNHIGQPFDIDTFSHVTEQIATSSVTLPFTVH